MSRTSNTAEAWQPQTRLDRDAVLRELEDVLTSPHFANSKRYPALLRYIVEKTLEGESDALKERTLGVEVFDRPASYDTNTDTVVRYTAGEVRKRLSLYYYELDRKPAIQISLPAGSYVPEFIHAHDEPDLAPGISLPEPHEELHPAAALPVANETHAAPAPQEKTLRLRSVAIGVGMIILLAAAAYLGAAWKSHRGPLATPVVSFWAPVLRDQSTVLLCTGGSVFAQNNFSGVITAGKDNEYPFVSMQTASAIGQVSGLVQVSGAETHLLSAASTPLSDLRERSLVLFGGYNNQWTMRLLQPFRFHFTPGDPPAAIVDSTQPGVSWQRDHSLSYSSADDYAIIARFHNTLTDSWVIALAGEGRNGTEAAAQFVTSPHYLQLLKDRLGSDFASHNIEVVLKVNVIDGKTGAPTILATHVW